ncbi:MAG: peptide/nickel transport system permease protein, partial [Chloroflexota bacterium]|nr:peptide/nickel transport system permease protein [Chloroflexota bacterium]
MVTLRRDRVAMLSLAVFLLIVVACLLAPVYEHSIAHTNAFTSHISGTTIVNGKKVPVLTSSTTGLALGVTPIGPTWDVHHYFLGADGQGRDVMARLLYGGRNSLLIGIASAVMACAIATVLGVAAGYFGGVLDSVLSRLFDVIWAFPPYLLGISLSVVLLTSGLKVGPVHIEGNSLWLPIVIIAVIYVPYIARPLRGQVMSMRNREFIVAGVGLGASDLRILRKDVLPNVMPTVLVFIP